MGKKTEWFEKFFAGLYTDILARQFTPAQSAAQARLAREALTLKRGARVLDVPCGMGRLSIPLAAMGMEVTGVDLMPHYVSRARRAAKKARVRARFAVADMRKLDYDGEFDAVVNWFTSFGYFSDADNALFLQRAFAALRPGGRLLIETMNKSWLLSHWDPYRKKDVGGVAVANISRFDRRTSRCIDRWEFSRRRGREKMDIVIKMFDAASMRKALRQAGFRDVRFYGWDFMETRLSRFTRHSKRMIAVATRPR